MLGLLSLIRKPWLLIAVAVAGAFAAGFWRGHEAASDSARAAQYEAQIAALEQEKRREIEIREKTERSNADLKNALRKINAQTPLTGSASRCQLDAGELCQLRAIYNPDIRCDAKISSLD